MSEMICQVVKIRARPGQGEALVQTFRDYARTVRAGEPGTRLYTLNAARDEADVYYAVEFYDDEAAMNLHAANFDKVAEKLTAPTAGPPEFLVLDYQAGYGVP
jgi:quinol monooxygenase YgiN